MGFCTVLQYATDGLIQTQYSYFVINALLIILAVLAMGIGFGFKTIYCIVVSSLAMGILSNCSALHCVEGEFFYVRENMLIALIAGSLEAVGIGLVIRNGGSTGGTDIIAQTIAHYTPISVGTVSFCFNGLVVGSSGYFIGFQPMLFSVIGMFCSSFMVNYVLTGFGTRRSKTVYIISDDIDSIGDRVVHELKRSGTVWEATGYYTGLRHKILMVLVQNHQYQRLLRIISQEDPRAFVYVGEAYRVLGKGFAPLKKIADSTVAED